MKCELCHDHAPKHQWFDEEGHELYICHECYVEKTTPKEDPFKGLEDVKTDLENNRECAIPTSTVGVFAELRKKLDNPTVINLFKEVEGTTIDSSVTFDATTRLITLKFKLTPTEADDVRPSDSEWVFDVNDRDNITMKAKCHFGNEDSELESFVRFTGKTMPTEAMATLGAIMMGYASTDKEEFTCDYE